MHEEWKGLIRAKKGSKCSWCGKDVSLDLAYSVNNEEVCIGCKIRGEREVKNDMDWLNGPGYDAWKTTPPDEGEPEELDCDCGEKLYEGDEYYEIDGTIYCPNCIDDFLSDHRRKVGD